MKGRGRRRSFLCIPRCVKNDNEHQDQHLEIVAAHQLSTLETLLGGGSHGRDQRRNDEDQQEDHEHHRPE
jgi:hypothetical protein